MSMGPLRYLLLALAALAFTSAPASAQVDTPLALELVADGLSLPVYATAVRDDSRRLVILEQASGKLLMLRDGLILPTPFLDVGELLHPQTGQIGELGLLGLAFHPDYANNRYFYIDYSDSHGDTQLVRYRTMLGNPDVANPNSATTMLSVSQPGLSHNAGMLAFGPSDDMLYLSLGDGGDAFDMGPGHAPEGNAQSPTTLLGKLLRLNVDIPAPYIPADNPYVGNPLVLDEIWSGGLRNPWRFSFDRVRGDLWIGDVGQAQREEINYQPFDSGGGENYGWRCQEGSLCTPVGGCVCFGPTLTFPVQEYAHGLGECAVVGGYVYRGQAVPDLVGRYLYGDLCTNRVWSLGFDHVSGTVTDEQELTPGLAPGTGTLNVLVSFGEDHNGELLLVSLFGQVWRLVPDGPFTGLGHALGGALGDPVLTGNGSLVPGESGGLQLKNALADRSTLLFVSLTEGAVPFFGGTLTPFPSALEVFVTTDSTGKINLPWLVWPSGLPSGQELFFQWAIDDPTAPFGVTLSNALQAELP